MNGFTAMRRRAREEDARCPKCARTNYPYLILEDLENRGRFALYYLPESHYVGVTSNLLARLNNHNGSGRPTTDCTVVDWFDNIYDALREEAKYHKMGYADS